MELLDKILLHLSLEVKKDESVGGSARHDYHYAEPALHAVKLNTHIILPRGW